MLVQWPGSVSSLLSFSLFKLCRGTGRNWSALSAAEAALTRLPIPATAQAQTLWRISKKMRLLIIIVILGTFGCSKTKTTTEQTVSDTTSLNHQTRIAPLDRGEEMARLMDTTSNGVKIQFRELNQKTFDSLQRQIKRTDLQLSSFDRQITKLDSCLTFKLNNGKTDSLCNMDDGEYYEKYQIKGLLTKSNSLLVNFENWEENHDFLINLKDGSYYILSPFYEVSPRQDLILGYVDIVTAPIYTGELLITRIEKGALTTLIKKDLGQISITDASWISNTDCLITTGTTVNKQNGTIDIKDKKLYLIKIE
jgi:hypothetical protein